MRIFLLSIFSFFLGSFLVGSNAVAGGSIQNHLTLDLSPIAMSTNNPIGGAFGVSYNRLHAELKTYYTLSVEVSIPYSGQYSGSNTRTDLLTSMAFATEVTPAFAVGGRVGIIVNDPSGPNGFGAVLLRLPALHPTDKEFFSFFFEEVDLGISGSGNRYAGFRFGMLLL